jgi:hypothetical protein
MRKQTRLTKLKSVPLPASSAGLSLRDIEGVARPMAADKTETITTRFSGAWLAIWQNVQRELPGISPSEIIRQSVALRAALVAKDELGGKVRAKIIYSDKSGQVLERDLEELIGLVEKQK